MIGETATMKASESCHKIHAQIGYTNAAGESVESLLGYDVVSQDDRAMLHALLDEWIYNRREGAEQEDHFIVYGKFPMVSK
jgi:hypothetical protein